MFKKPINSWIIPARPVISGSRLISRACIAGATADGLLLDRPGRGGWRSLRRFLSMAFLALALVSHPLKTGEAEDQARAAERFSVEASIAFAGPSFGWSVN